MPRSTDISRLAREPSLVLRNAPTYFELTGAGVIGIAVANLVASAIGSRAFLFGIAQWGFHPLTALITAAGLIWTGREMRHRRRTSAYGAVIAAVAIIAEQVTRPSPSAMALAFAVAGLVLIGAIWDELE